VVVTGAGIYSPLGNSLDTVRGALREGRSGVRPMEAWADIDDLHTQVAGVVQGVDPRQIPRRQRRSMGRTSILAVLAARDALSGSGLDPATLASGRCGVSVAATVGSARSVDEFCGEIHTTRSVRGLRSTAFLQFMGHSPAANVALANGIAGRCISPTSACASGNQAIGLAAEAIAAGSQDVMVAGGAEELHHLSAATFVAAGAASTAFNDRPGATPRPFDVDRDGLVVGEGAGVLVLEELQHARRRGAPVLAELRGFATVTDPSHMTSPDPATMERCIRLALADGGVDAAEVDHVNAHATGTVAGDAAEATACRAVYGDGAAVSSSKGFTGHGLGAAGGIESVLCLLAMLDGWLPASHNLRQPDPACEGLDLLVAPRQTRVEVAANHSFAFGGVASVLIFSAVRS